MQPPDAIVGLDLAPRHLALLQALSTEHLTDAEVLAFGSRVNGGAHEGSDLDLVVRDGTDPDRAVPGTTRLRRALQDSALPMRVEVHDWKGLPASFRAEIERRHLRIAAA